MKKPFQAPPPKAVLPATAAKNTDKVKPTSKDGIMKPFKEGKIDKKD